MSSGSTEVAALDVIESDASIPTDPNVTRMRRKGGVLQAAVAGGEWSEVGATAIDVVSDWAADQIEFLAARAAALAITLDNVRVLNVGLQPYPTNGVSGGLQGGSWSGGNAVIVQMSSPILLTPATTPFAIVFRGTIAAPTVARTAAFGLFNAAGNHAIYCGTQFDQSATKFILLVAGGATASDPTTANADTALHDFAIISDGVTITLFVDGVDSGASLAASLVTEEPLFPAIFNSISLDAVCKFALVAW